MKNFICLFYVFALFLCAPGQIEAQEYGDEPDEAEGLMSFTPDTIINANPRLVRLMDLVYVYTSPSSFPSSDNIGKDLKWMDDFRLKLCAYYRETRPADNVSEYVMADSVISETRRLWAGTNNGSTVDMLIYNDIERSRLLFEHYNAYSRLYSGCATGEEKELLAAEFQAWLQLEKQYAEFYRLCVFMAYWRGSLAGVIYGGGLLDLCQSHIDLYRKEYVLKSGSDSFVDMNGVGTFVGPAKDLLLSCSKQALMECDEFDSSPEDVADCYGEDYFDKDYERLHKKAWNLEPKLSKYIDNWVEKRKAWEETGISGIPEQYSLNTAEVLIKMASLVSSIR